MDALAAAIAALERKLGRVEFETLEIPCADTHTYREEMGENLMRRFYSFERRVDRDALVDLKAICHKIEPQFADTVDGFHFRTVNIDPGILSLENVMMASHRGYNHQIYLRNGVYAEVALIFAGGALRKLPWTNPDFCDDEAISFFERTHQNLLKHQKNFQLIDS